MVERLNIILKAVDMHHVWVTGIPKGPSMPPLVGKVNLKTHFCKIVNDFFVLFDGLTKTVAYHNGAPGICRAIDFIVKPPATAERT